MPYDNLSDLPDSVRNNLPEHAQEIYRAAFTQPRSSTGKRSVPTASPGALWSRNTRRTNRATG